MLAFGAAVPLLSQSRAVAAAVAVPPLGGVRRTLPSGRTYVLSNPGMPRLVVGLHGTGLSADNANRTFDNVQGWQGHAQANGYTLALGEAAAGSWNAGGGWPSSGHDDLGYLADVAADAAPAATAFVAGFSAGGAMAWTAAAMLPAVFAAAGSASGWAPVRAAQPVDVWHVHGTADTTVPVRGGAGTGGFDFPAAYLEAALAARGSRVVLEPTGGGHGTAGWMADRLWRFWATARP